MKKMFTLMALALVVSLSGYAQKHYVATAKKVESIHKVSAMPLKPGKRAPMAAATGRNNTPTKASVAKAASKAPEVVTPPAYGEVEYYTLNGSYRTYGGSAWSSPVSYERTVKVVFDGNDVYISGLFHYITDAYIKGSTEDGETVVFPKGQYLGSVGSNALYAASHDDEFNFYDIEATFDNEGNFTFDTRLSTCSVEDEELKGVFAYGEEGVTLTPAGEDVVIPIEPPLSLKTEDYIFYGDNYWAGQGNEPDNVTRPLKVGFYGNDVYVQGFCEMFPEAWMKGTLNGNKITFPRYTYLGTYANKYDFYTLGLNSGYSDDDYTFTYDEAEGKLTCTTYFFTIYYEYPPYGGNDYGFDEIYQNVTITKVQEKAGTPEKPSIANMGFGPYGDYLDYNINLVDTEGNGLVADKVSYKLWSEDELGTQQEVEFTTADYENLEENLTEIPFTFIDNYDFENGTIWLNMDEHYNWVKVGLQTIYKGGGETHESEITWYEIPWYVYWGKEPAVDVTEHEVKGTQDLNNTTDYEGTALVGFINDETIFIKGLIADFSDGFIIGFKEGNSFVFDNGQWLADNMSSGFSVYALGYDSSLKKIEDFKLSIDEENGVYVFDNTLVANTDYIDKIYYWTSLNAGTTIAINGKDTGISELKSSKAALTGKAYNLAGQQVSKQYKGIVISDGKKIIKK